MAGDLRTSPWIYPRCKEYDILFCVDGHGYVMNKKTDESAHLESHAKLAALQITPRPASRKACGGRVRQNRDQHLGSFGPDG
ncbi:hypothetical protein CWO91_22550 [Bradyrhizobium genosp. SA-3]|nr:hypothetical protein CWO91_22550 [Bradyrhizobium genosp. SA-3]